MNKLVFPYLDQVDLENIIWFLISSKLVLFKQQLTNSFIIMNIFILLVVKCKEKTLKLSNE